MTPEFTQELTVTIKLLAGHRSVQVEIANGQQSVSQEVTPDNLLTRIQVDVANALRYSCREIEKLAHGKPAAADTYR